jgi:hypothetical protein
MAFAAMQGGFGLWEPLTVEDYTVVEFQPWWLTLGGAVLCVVGGWWFRTSTRATAVDWDEPRPPQDSGLPPVLATVPSPTVLPLV